MEILAEDVQVSCADLIKTKLRNVVEFGIKLITAAVSRELYGDYQERTEAA